jgi:hypothetical protein
MASKASEVPDLSLVDQGRERLAWALQEQRLLLVCLALLCVVGSTYAAIGNAQEVLGPCDPSFVQQTLLRRHLQALCGWNGWAIQASC